MKCDLIFKNMLEEVLYKGEYADDKPTRPVYPDTGLPAYTIRKFGIVNRYNLKEEFPIPTLRPIPLKNCIDEILWIWQKKSSSIKDLNSHIWDSWAGEDGTIGKAYGYQVKNKLRKVKTTIRKLKEANLKFVYMGEIRDNEEIVYPLLLSKITDEEMLDLENEYYLDQTDFILYELQNNPYSRRILGELYCIDDIPEMNLEPCCYSITLNVVGNTLNMILNQRSADLITAGNWNVFQYAILLKLFAIHCGLEAGELVHVIADAHIYDRHINIAKELISREPFEGAKLYINPEKTNFYDFTVDDFKIENYNHHPQIKNIIVAV